MSIPRQKMEHFQLPSEDNTRPASGKFVFEGASRVLLKLSRAHGEPQFDEIYGLIKTQSAGTLGDLKVLSLDADPFYYAESGALEKLNECKDDERIQLNPDAFANAVMLVETMPGAIPTPSYASVTDDGRITLSWRNGTELVSLLIDESQFYYFSAIFDDGTEESAKYPHQSDISACLVHLIHRVYA